MEKDIIFSERIISGDTVRDFTKVFPELTQKFHSRKGYDEYYWDEMKNVEISIDKIDKLVNDEFFTVVITVIDLEIKLQ